MPDDLLPRAGAAVVANVSRSREAFPGEHDIMAWLRAGYDPHPVIPPGVTMHPASKVKPENRGKSPGVVVEGTELWTGVHWLRPFADRVRLQQGGLWRASFLAGNGGCATGRLINAIDIDCHDAALSARLRGAAQRHNGWSPVRVGQPPKCLLVYTAAKDEPPQPTRTFNWVKPGVKKVGIEILGAGRQFVCKGTHPVTLLPYTWDTDPLLAAEAGMLAPLSSAGVRAFIDEMKIIMRLEGYELAASATGGRAGGDPPPQESLLAHDMAVLEAAVAAIPNPPDTPREDYIALGAAIKAASGPKREMQGFLIWQDWADRWEPEDPARANTTETLEADWARLKPPFHLGADYVYDLAARHGWSKAPVVRAAFAADPLSAVEHDAAEAEEEHRREHPHVVLGPGSKDEALDAIGVAVSLAPSLFRNPGGELVAIRWPGDRRRRAAAGVELPAAAPVLEVASPSDVFLAACNDVRFFKIGRRGDRERCDPPRDMAKDYLTTRRGADARPLLGLAAVPGITEAGEIIGAEGYSPATARLHLPCPSFEVPEQPSAADVKAALADLQAPFSEFPFPSPEAGQVFGPGLSLALVVTAIRRPWLPRAPMFVATAPTPGSGKGLLMSTACTIAFGSDPATFTFGEDEAEQSKRLAAALLAGASAIMLDNVNNGTIEGDQLEAALTADTISLRPLGQSRQVRVSTSTLLLANGNHCRVGGDMARRALVIQLDPECERPELRTFSFDPRELARTRRAHFLRAAFILLRAYRRAGWPVSGLPPLGSFEVWSREVRDLLVWLGLPDVVASMTSSRDADPRRSANAALLAALHERYGARRFTGADVVAWARGQADSLAEAVALVMAPRSGRPLDARAAGVWAQAVERTVFGGLRLIREADAHSKANTYRVERVAP